MTSGGDAATPVTRTAGDGDSSAPLRVSGGVTSPRHAACRAWGEKNRPHAPRVGERRPRGAKSMRAAAAAFGVDMIIAVIMVMRMRATAAAAFVRMSMSVRIEQRGSEAAFPRHQLLDGAFGRHQGHHFGGGECRRRGRGHDGADGPGGRRSTSSGCPRCRRPPWSLG